MIDLPESCEAVVTPFVALGELKAGFAAGSRIATNDLWIAALAVQHGLSLVSRGRHFDALPQVSRWV